MHMNVKLLRVENSEFVNAEIIDAKNLKLPSIHEGWRFNFTKYSKEKGTQTFVIVILETPDVFEGCLIYNLGRVIIKAGWLSMFLRNWRKTKIN